MARKKVDSKKKKAEKQAKQAPQADKEPKVNACDASYRQYFSFREVMEDFLRYYVPEKLRGIVHYDSLRRYDSQNITRNWTDSREDLIWCAQTLKTVERDIYFPVEFQSAESKEMLFRLLQYVAILYRALLDEGVLKTSGGSTLILPIVIYNGDKPWSAARSMNEIHDPIEEDLKGGFQVHFKYFVVDIGRLEPKLLEQDSLPTRLFRLERVKDEKELITTVKDIANRFRQEERHQELARILCGWVKRIGLKRLKIGDQRFEAIHELEEFGAMLENVLPDWEERIRKDERAMLENVLPNWEERIRKEARKENTNEIAKKMLALNEKIEKIMQFTGLTKEDILALKIQNANV